MSDDLRRRLEEVPGVGPKRARRIVDELDLTGEEALRVAVESDQIEEASGVSRVRRGG